MFGGPPYQQMVQDFVFVPVITYAVSSSGVGDTTLLFLAAMVYTVQGVPIIADGIMINLKIDQNFAS